MNKKIRPLFVLLTLPTLLSCGGKAASSERSSSSEEKIEKVLVTDYELPLAYFENGLKNRLLQKSLGIQFSSEGEEKPLFSLALDLQSSPNLPSTGSLSSGAYYLEGRSDSLLFKASRMDDKSLFATYFGTPYLDMTLRSEDGSFSLPFTQGASLSLGTAGSRPFGLYLDLSKAAITRNLLENAFSDLRLEERYYADLGAPYEGLSFPLFNETGALALASELRSQASEALEKGQGSLYYVPSEETYELSFSYQDFEKDRERFLASLERSPMDEKEKESLRQALESIESADLDMAFSFKTSSLDSLLLSGEYRFKQKEKGGIRSLSYSLPGTFLGEEESAYALPESYQNETLWPK